MAAVANIVLADAQATPVNHTFIPLGPDQNNVWWYEDQSATSEIGYGRVSVSISKPGNPSAGSNSQDRVTRVKFGIHTPKLETVSNNSAGLVPPPTVAYIPRSTQEFLLPQRGTLQDRKDLRKFTYLLAQHQVAIDAIESLQGPF